MKLTETSSQTYNTLKRFASLLSKTDVTCEDSSGFIVNRLLIPYLMEAIRMVERGHAADYKEVDTAMKLGELCLYAMQLIFDSILTDSCYIYLRTFLQLF